MGLPSPIQRSRGDRPGIANQFGFIHPRHQCRLNLFDDQAKQRLVPLRQSLLSHRQYQLNPYRPGITGTPYEVGHDPAVRSLRRAEENRRQKVGGGIIGRLIGPQRLHKAEFELQQPNAVSCGARRFKPSLPARLKSRRLFESQDSNHRSPMRKLALLLGLDRTDLHETIPPKALHYVLNHGGSLKIAHFVLVGIKVLRQFGQWDEMRCTQQSSPLLS